MTMGSYVSDYSNIVKPFQCVSLPSRPNQIIPPLTNPPKFNCWASGANIAQFSIMNGDTVSSSTAPVYAANGRLLPDTGLTEEIVTTNSSVFQPCVSGWRITSLNFPISINNQYPDGFTIMNFTYNTNFAFTSNTIFATNPLNYSGAVAPTSVEFLHSGCSPLTDFNSNAPISAQHNSGRNIFVPFAYMFDMSTGIVAYAPYETYLSYLRNDNSGTHLTSISSFIVFISSFIVLVANHLCN
jgi:hypothetical protein